MEPGDLVGGRFAVEARAGSGGMGTVFRAIDRQTGEPIALKVLHVRTSEARARFAREARVLADLQHPGIVRYVAHGETAEGDRYLAMEWIDGEDLHERMRRSTFTVAESVGMVLRAAQALAVAHARGVVHRDIKPSNLFLVGHDVERVKLLDFGIARTRAAEVNDVETMLGTNTGVMMGTLGYFAPEQARGAKQIGVRADVFSLGCVLFRCLTGRQPFVGDDPSAVLAKILFEDAPRVKELRPEAPGSVDDLVGRMLSKEPLDRPADASAVVTELSELGDLGRVSATPRIAPVASLTTGERRLVSVVALAPAALLDDSPSFERPSTEPIQSSDGSIPSLDESPTELAGTIMDRDTTRVDGAEGFREARETAKAHGARLERLADGVVVVALTGQGAATDQAVRAARCALALRAHWRLAPISLATGRGVLVERLPVGDVIDRAMRMLRAAQRSHGAADDVDGQSIQVDETTAGLLDARFELGGGSAGLELRHEREIAESVRTLLGRPTPCVGREAELAVLLRLYEECVDAPRAQAVLVTAPSGVGKSRLRYEILRQLEEPHDGLPAPDVWIARGDAMSAGSPFGMLAQAIRRACGLKQGEPLAVRQQKLRARIARHLEGADLARVTEFLGELVGVPFDDVASVQLRAARQSPVLMGDQMRRAWEDWLTAESAASPILLVLEDLQWGDLPTISFVDAALRNLKERAFMILALARPDVHELFPRLWADRRTQEIRLGELTRRAGEKLARNILGDGVAAPTLARLVDLAAGNAFYLEELIRAVAEGKEQALPETVLAMVQARLEGLDGEARRILRAASVFGGVFWRGGLVALLGGSRAESEVDSWLAILEDRELVSRRAEGRFPGEEELVFRHALVREAAYAMLTDDDRVLGHRLAADWLERAGETEALVLAEHYERAREPDRALGWFDRAAVEALEGNDFAAALARAERACECGAVGEARGAMRLLQAEAHRWEGGHAESQRCADEAMRLLGPGSPRWFAAAGEVAEASEKVADTERLIAIGQELCERGVDQTRGSLPLIAVARCTSVLFFAGQYALAERLLGVLEGAEERIAADPAVGAFVDRASATRAMFDGDVGALLELATRARNRFEQAGDLRNVARMSNFVGFAAIEAGAYELAEVALEGLVRDAERMGLKSMAATARQNLGLACARRGALDKALRLEAEALEAFQTHGDRRMEGGSHLYLAIIHQLAGDLERAHQAALAATEVLATTPPGQAYALAMLSHVELARGSVDRACNAAQRAMDLLESLGVIEEGEALVRLSYAEAMDAAGKGEEMRRSILAAAERLQSRAARISDPALRRSFLEQVPDNARTMEKAGAVRASTP